MMEKKIVLITNPPIANKKYANPGFIYAIYKPKAIAIIIIIPVGSSVETEKQTNSTIKEELSLKDQFVFEKDFVLFNNHPIKMPNQQQKILTFFLNSPNYSTQFI